jgi:hypothetical protein
VSETMLFGEPLADFTLASSGAARQEKERHGVSVALTYPDGPGRDTP